MALVEQWTGKHACLLQQAMGLTNERFAERVRVSVRTVANWRTQGDQKLPDLAQRALPAVLAAAGDTVCSEFTLLVHETGVTPQTKRSQCIVDAMAEEANLELLRHSSQSDPESITWLWEEMTAVARDSNSTAYSNFTESKRIYTYARELAERTRHPGKIADLYVIVSQAAAIMGSTAFDLGNWDASTSLARLSNMYADMAGHASLQAWTFGLRATLANWRNRPDAALNCYRQALEIAPPGIPRMRLHYIASRSYALLGETEAVGRVLAKGEADRAIAETHEDRLSIEVGGEFAFGDARAAACAAAAWLDVERGEEAEEYAQLALTALTRLPRVRQPFSQVNGAKIDMAAARLLTGNRDGAEEIVREVLSLPPAMRNVSLAGRMGRVRQTLLDLPWRDDPQAADLAETITGWLAETSARPVGSE